MMVVRWRRVDSAATCVAGSSRDRYFVDLGKLQLNQCRDAIENVAEFIARELGRVPVLPILIATIVLVFRSTPPW
jgi:hypothetical protein